MIEAYKWQGHPDQERDKDVGFYVIKPSRFITDGRPGHRGEYQYLGWFYMNGECHFSDRLNHTAAPDKLGNIKLPLTKENWQSMIKHIFEEDWKIEL